MPRAGQRSELIEFQRAGAGEDEYGGETGGWSALFSRRASVRFGTAQEKREAAQEGGVQSATFECVRSAELDTVTLKDRISYLGSFWDLTEVAPLSRKTIRFTGARAI